MNAPLTRRDLDSAGCGDPSCPDPHTPPRAMFARCHRVGALRVRYVGSGIVELSCPVCGALVASLLVAGAPADVHTH